MKRYFCTYFDRNYFFKAMTMIASIRKYASEFTLFAICLDEESHKALEKLALPDVVTIPLHEIEQYDDALLSAKQGRSCVEYYFTLTPTAILRLMEKNPEVDVMTYVDADLFFYSSPEPIFIELGDNSALIHEHRYSPVEAYKEKLYGKYNVGLLCFKNNDIGLSVVKWWRNKCLEWCFNRAENGKYADQGYLNEFPDRFKDVVVLQHKGAGVALWNHDQYKYRIDTSGKILVDGFPLIFFHFSALQMVFPDFILPDKYGSYPRFTITELNGILIPYIQCLFSTIAEIHTVVPAFEYGLKDDVHVTVIHDFLSKDHVNAKIATMNLPHIPIPLRDKWCFHQGEEPSAVAQKSSMESANKPATEGKGNRNAFSNEQGPDCEKIMTVVNALNKRGKKEIAGWILDKILVYDPDNAHAHNRRAWLALSFGDSESALYHYTRAAKLAPDNVGFLKDLGDFYYSERKDAEAALAQYIKVLTILPKDRDVILKAGRSCASMGRFEEACRYYERILAVTTDPYIPG